MKKSGVYKIVNTATGDFYIGGSIDINNRWKQHRFLLGKNKHHNKHLQNAWNKYGSEVFEFNILEECRLDKQIILGLEQSYIDILKPVYNFCPIAGSSLGREVSSETRKKLSEANKGQIPWIQGKSHTDETKAKMSRAHKGMRHSEAAKQKIREASTGNQNTFGYKHSEEAKAKMRELKKGNTNMLGKKHSEETKLKIKLANASKTPIKVCRVSDRKEMDIGNFVKWLKKEK